MILALAAVCLALTAGQASASHVSCGDTITADMTLAGGDLRLKTLEPPAGDGLEAKSRQDRHASLTGRRDQREPLTPRRGEVEADRAEVQPARVAPADRVLPIRLAVDTALDPNAAGGGRSHRNPPCLGSRPSPPNVKLTES
jgi:hypothetical protein